MFLIRKPSRAAIEVFLLQQQKGAFSYVEIGATNGPLPRDYVVDRNRVMLGSGPRIFLEGAARLRA